MNVALCCIVVVLVSSFPIYVCSWKQHSRKEKVEIAVDEGIEQREFS